MLVANSCCFSRLCFLDEINSGKTVRLIYSGQLLQDDNAPISFYGVSNCSVVHAQVSDIRRTRRDYEHSSTATQEADLDMSKLFLPMLAIVLLFCWYGFFYYRHLFSAASVIILVFMTIAFGVLAYIMTSWTSPFKLRKLWTLRPSFSKACYCSPPLIQWQTLKSLSKTWLAKIGWKIFHDQRTDCNLENFNQLCNEVNTNTNTNTLNFHQCNVSLKTQSK